MAEEFKPRKRGQTINRRLARFMAANGVGAAVGGVVFAIGMGLERTQPIHAQGIGLSLKILGGVMQVGGASLFDVMALWVVAPVLIAKTNPKEFVSMVPRHFVRAYWEVIKERGWYRLARG